MDPLPPALPPHPWRSLSILEDRGSLSGTCHSPRRGSIEPRRETSFPFLPFSPQEAARLPFTTEAAEVSGTTTTTMASAGLIVGVLRQAVRNTTKILRNKLSSVSRPSGPD